MELSAFSNHCRAKIDQVCIDFINQLNLAKTLKASILYSYTAGGKRIRPLLLLAMVQAFNEDINKAINTAASLELIHTSSLIHDDLPAMDNDDYRRGKLTNHKIYGEATAILAGDSLLVNSFQLIIQDDKLTPLTKLALIDKLANCTGANGMVGGQQLDIENDNQALNIETLKKINLYKTGKLIEFSLVAPAIICNQDNEIILQLEQISFHIGIAFQIQDDILDVIGNKSITGKSTNSDNKNNKVTYVSFLGINKAKQELIFHFEQALNILRRLNLHSELVEAIFNLIIKRDK